MKREKIVLRAMDVLGVAFHIPHITMFTKLIEEIIDSELETLMLLNKGVDLDKGKLLGLLGSGRMMMGYAFNEEFTEAMQRRQLLNAWSQFHQAYHLLKLRPEYAQHSVRAAKSIAACHYFLGHRKEAKDWIAQAIQDNITYHYPEDHDDLLDVQKLLNDPLYIAAGM
jgi:hypothetical protein